MWSLVAPREVGGRELPLPELADLFERLGRPIRRSVGSL
jgi:hypothetical protein